MIYFIQQHDTEYVKIGYTRYNVRNRLRTLQIGNPCRLKLLAVFPGNKNDETVYHDLYKNQAIRGEWFKLSVRDISGIRQHHTDKTDKNNNHDFYCKPKLDVIVWFKNIMNINNT